MCKQRMMGARLLHVEDGWIRVRQLQINNMYTELDNSVFSAVELDHSTLRACARELDNYG